MKVSPSRKLKICVKYSGENIVIPREAAAFFAADGIADGQNKAADKRSGHGKAHPALQKIKKIGNKVVHELPPDLIYQLVSPFAVLSSSMRALTFCRKASHASSFST